MPWCIPGWFIGASRPNYLIVWHITGQRLCLLAGRQGGAMLWLRVGCLYVCACVCVCLQRGCRCTCMHIYVKAMPPFSVDLQELFTLVLGTWSLTENRRRWIRAGLLPTEPRGIYCTHVSGARITMMAHHTQLLYVGARTLTQVLRLALWVLHQFGYLPRNLPTFYFKTQCLALNSLCTLGWS